MSWISDLAGKAENILNKLDQNAATVLQVSQSRPTGDTPKSEEMIRPEVPSTETIRRNLSSNSLSLSRSLTPKKVNKIESNKMENGDTSVKSEKAADTDSNLSSRRSSFGSKVDDGNPIESEMTSSINSNSKFVNNNADISLESELSAVKIILAEVTTERNELRLELHEIKQSNVEGRLIDLEQLVDALAVERDQVTGERDETKRIVQQQLKTISELEASLSQTRQSLNDLTEKIQWQSKEIAQKSIEFEEYRKKAQSTLHMKERLIEELKANGSQFEDTAETSNEKLLNMEINGLRQENHHLHDELRDLRNQIGSTKTFIENLEHQLNEKSTELASIRDKLTAEQHRAQQFESENRILNQELTTVRDELNRQRQSFSARLHEKEKEVVKLRSQISETPGGEGEGGNGLSDCNFENRMQSLTQALVKKQAALETTTAERNALRLQLEKVEDQLRHLMIQQRQQRVQIVNVNDTDDVKAQLPLLMQENPFDTNVARRVKRAYTSLDSAGIRIGVFLRRYPLVRIMVFIYVAFLHLWVMFVLLSSTPS